MQDSKDFELYSKKNTLFTPASNILVAVSGGVDSMVLLHLLQQGGYKIAVAHCNFKLRGKESDGDEAFVEEYCNEHNIPLHTIQFDTKKEAKQGESVQMAARRLRYEWFNQLADVFKYNCIAIAHNANDVAETFFINLSRGTGLTGLTGIKPKVANVVRPLLFATRKQIKKYAKHNKLDWREDSSNKNDKYTRNLIRHKIVPAFEKLNPAFIDSINKTVERLEQSNAIIKAEVAKALKKISVEKNNVLHVDLAGLKKLNPVSLYLFEMLSGYGFNGDQAEDIEQALSRTAGQKFLSPTHELICDRKEVIIRPIAKKKTEEVFTIGEDLKTKPLPVQLKFSIKKNSKTIKLKQPPTIALVDYNKLKFPLTLRRPKIGDRFQPFGMKQSKLLSDFFKDQKLSAIEKEQVWIVESAGKIVWIAGHRVDNRFAVTEKTRKILEMAMS